MNPSSPKNSVSGPIGPEYSRPSKLLSNSARSRRMSSRLIALMLGHSCGHHVANGRGHDQVFLAERMSLNPAAGQFRIVRDQAIAETQFDRARFEVEGENHEFSQIGNLGFS